MKMKSRKFKFNIIDVIIVFVVVVAFVASLAFVSSKAPDGGGLLNIIGIGEKNNVHYTIEVQRAPLNYKYNYNIGDRVYDSLSGAFLGTVESVEAVPATDNIADVVNGTFVLSEYPEKEDVYITLKTVPGISEKGIWVAGHYIKVGKLMRIQTSGCVGEGYIVNVDMDSKGGAYK